MVLTACRAAAISALKAAPLILIGVGGKLAGFMVIADPNRATTPLALESLKAAGVRVVVLTGDGKTTAEGVARQSGIDAVVAEVFPQDKVAVGQRLMKEGQVNPGCLNGEDGGRSPH